MNGFSTLHRWLACGAILGSPLASAESTPRDISRESKPCCTVPAPASTRPWTSSRQVYATWRSNLVETHGVARHTRSVGAGTRFDFASSTRPYSGGVAIEYRVVENQRNAALASGYFAYKTAAWLVTGVVTGEKRLDASSRWLYAGSALYRLGPRHRLGVEVRGAIEGAYASKRMLAYYGKLSDSVSVSVAVGSTTSGPAARVALTALTWRFQ